MASWRDVRWASADADNRGGLTAEDWGSGTVEIHVSNSVSAMGRILTEAEAVSLAKWILDPLRRARLNGGREASND